MTSLWTTRPCSESDPESGVRLFRDGEEVGTMPELTAISLARSLLHSADESVMRRARAVRAAAGEGLAELAGASGQVPS